MQVFFTVGPTRRRMFGRSHGDVRGRARDEVIPCQGRHLVGIESRRQTLLVANSLRIEGHDFEKPRMARESSLQNLDNTYHGISRARRSALTRLTMAASDDRHVSRLSG